MNTRSPQHPASLDPVRLLKDCQVTFGRGSGPGGQHRNKVETAVHIKHLSSGIIAQAGERRNQRENYKVALFRLRVNLALQLCQARNHEADTPPSTLWQSRCRNAQVHVNAHHEDFPAILAEAMDVLAACDYDPKSAGHRLGCSASQLIKLIKSEPRALASVNQHRLQRQLHPLR